MAGILFGFTICIKTKFQITPPNAKKRTANPVALFLSRGNWVHKLFIIGIELIANEEEGINKQQNVRVNKFNFIFIRIGDMKKQIEHILITLW